MIEGILGFLFAAAKHRTKDTNSIFGKEIKKITIPYDAETGRSRLYISLLNGESYEIQVYLVAKEEI